MRNAKTLFLVLLIQLISTTCAMATTDTPRKVLVTGAGGKTGHLVMQQLLSRPAFAPTGVVRTVSSKENLVRELGIPDSQIVVADICDASSIQQACRGMDALIICTSATVAPTGEMTTDGKPKFGFPNGQPEQVDWIGQKNQIDAAKQAGMSHVVICSSMGGTDPENRLNTFGRDENGKGGNILLWKRKAEKYLIDSGITYTVVHPGGLIDEEGGKREIVVGVDDQQVKTDNRSIPRADVAALLIASLEHDSYKNRSFDARTMPVGEGTITTDFGKLLVDMRENCDYSLGKVAE